MKVSMNKRSWAFGALDAFNTVAARPSQFSDEIAYFAGRVEGEAWRLEGLVLSKQLRKCDVEFLEVVKVGSEPAAIRILSSD
jgi:hypothetical protein